jgi:hypothetical protein
MPLPGRPEDGGGSNELGQDWLQLLGTYSAIGLG